MIARLVIAIMLLVFIVWVVASFITYTNPPSDDDPGDEN